MASGSGLGVTWTVAGREMLMQAMDRRDYHNSSSMLQCCGAGGQALPSPPASSMDVSTVCGDGTPSGYTRFPSVLTLCEVDIDNSMHKLFDGLPEILDDSIYNRADEAVTVASPFTPSAQAATKFSSVPYFTGSHVRPEAVNLDLQQSERLAAVTAVPYMTAATTEAKPVFRRPKSQENLHPSVAALADHRKDGRPRRVIKAGAGRAGRIAAPLLESEAAPAPLPSITRFPVTKPEMAEAVPVGIPALPFLSAAAPADVDRQLPQPPVQQNVGLGPYLVPPLKRPRNLKEQALSNTRTAKTRYFDKVEHIVRERWRRDDMAGKFLALESLLPPSSKRDRSTIVEDSMKLVKSLQHRKEEAAKRRAELKSAVASDGVNKLNIKPTSFHRIGSLAVMSTSSQYSLQSSPESGSPSSSFMPVLQLPRGAGQKPSTTATTTSSDIISVQIPKHMRDCVKRFHIQTELSVEDNIVIETICEWIPNFQSLLLQSLESLGVEVTRCSITRTHKRLLFCNITVKPCPSSAFGKISSTSIMESLNSAFRPAA